MEAVLHPVIRSCSEAGGWAVCDGGVTVNILLQPSIITHANKHRSHSAPGFACFNASRPVACHTSGKRSWRVIGNHLQSSKLPCPKNPELFSSQ